MKTEVGRSMIEMLGVLAIIGVLSIGGLVAYRQAMISYRMSKVYDFVSKVRMYDKEVCTFGAQCATSGNSTQEGVQNSAALCSYLGNDAEYCGGSLIVGYRYLPAVPSMGWFLSGTSTEGRIYLLAVPKEICYRIIDGTWNDFTSIGVYGKTQNPLTDGRITSDATKTTLKKSCDSLQTNYNMPWVLYFNR